LRYLAEGAFGTTREACRERDLLLRLAPHLVESVPFLFPSFEDSRVPLWKVRAALGVYSVLAGPGRGGFRMIGPDEASALCPALRIAGLRGAGLYHDGQADDARLVLENLLSARQLGGGRVDAVSHAEVVGFECDSGGELRAARVRDRHSGTDVTIAAGAFVNAAGPAIERVRGLDRGAVDEHVRPAKGVHVVLPVGRVPTRTAVTFEAEDARQLFLVPWGEVALLGTTDSWSDEIDAPRVTIEEVHYLLDAANAAFPGLALNTNDIRSVYAGVRPLVAAPGESTPPGSVSREHRVASDPSGLLSVSGGKLTTHRAMGESVIRRVLRTLGRPRRPLRSPTRRLPLREGAAEWQTLARQLSLRFGLDAPVADHLARTCGSGVEALVAAAPAEERRPLGGSRHSLVELRWRARHECAVTLCDLLERRTRICLRSEGQGLPELARIAAVAAEELGWDEGRRKDETAAYADSVRTHYQIAHPRFARDAA
jgi:glycerol-3-phosphate dehydrogenase